MRIIHYLLTLLSITVLSEAVLSGIPEPPSMVKQPKHQQLFQVTSSNDENPKPFTLECEAKGKPEPKYRWIKNGVDFDYVAYDKRISQQPRRGTLHFTKPEVVDEGLYQCFATNIYGTSVSNAVSLRRSELNHFQEAEPEEKVVTEGEPLSIDCKPPSGYPKPVIFWMITSSSGALTSINSSRLTVDPEGNLHFSNITKEDELTDNGAFACSATSFFRTEYKIGRKVFLKVKSSGTSGPISHAPVTQYVSPTHVSAFRGQNLELHCIYGGTPLPDVVWRRFKSPLYGSRYTFLNYGKTLQINDVQFEDAGDYVCHASNGIGSQQSHSTYVEVLSAPFWKKVPENTNAAEGETVEFECEADGAPHPSLQWFMNGQVIEKAPYNRRRKVKDNKLIIEDLLKSDTGVFQCNASNAHGYAFKDFFLNVLALEPSILEEPAILTSAVATSNVILKCRVFGAPKPTITWKRNNKEITGGVYEISPEGDLTIHNVIYDHRGLYTCVAKNKFGKAEANGSLEIKAKTEINRVPENHSNEAGKVAIFRCGARSDPSLKLNIIWSFEGKEIDFEQNQRMVKLADNSLSISNTRELDSGKYTCTAKTELDEVSATATLTVMDVPNPPEIESVTCNRLTASIKWKPKGDNRSPIVSSIIQYNTSFVPDVWEDMTHRVPAPESVSDVSLSPWANYTFRVISVNQVGPSPPSKHSEMCTTEEDVPHDNPKQVVGKGTNPHNMVISWSPMRKIEHNAPGFFYKVYWKREELYNDAWKSAIVTDWKQNSYIVENTPTFVRYRIKVEAHNRKGQAHVVPSEVIGYSGEDKPTQAPKNFQLLRVIDATTAEFSWEPVAQDSIHGHFKGYKIQTWLSTEDEENMREYLVLREATSAKLPILKPFSLNYVQILAFNERYNGPPSERIQVQTPEGVPGPVYNFDAVPMGSSALYLVWKPPENKNGEIIGYNISYIELDGTKTGSTQVKDPIKDPNVLSYKLAGLKPNTRYRINIKATTRAGDGEDYFIEKATRGEEDIIPDPPHFSWTPKEDNEGNTFMRITWLPSFSSGKPGSHFYVQYRKKGKLVTLVVT